MTVNEAVPNFLKFVKVYNKPATYEYYKQYLRYISDFIGNIEVASLNRDVVLNMILEKQKQNPNISNTTLNKYIGVTQTLYKHVMQKDLDVRKLKQRVPETKIISNQTINRVFDYYDKRKYDRTDYRNYVYFSLSLDTGLRLNEMLNIKVSNIDFENNTIFVDVTKTDKDRTVVFTNRTATLLKVFILVYHQNYEYLFMNYIGKKRLSSSSVESVVTALKAKLKIKEDFYPHAWRHTFATNFIKKGGNVVLLKELMGHSNLKTTQKYLHLGKDDLIKGYIDPYFA